VSAVEEFQSACDVIEEDVRAYPVTFFYALRRAALGRIAELEAENERLRFHPIPLEVEGVAREDR
jgi:hypothetical protein